MIAATLTLPTLYVVFASWLHPLGILSVALAWACGYPIAFAVLAALAAREIRISYRDFFRRIGGAALHAAGPESGGSGHASLHDASR